jgi:hypothetical protein
MLFTSADLRYWSKEAIDKECRTAYRTYIRGLEEHYIDYFRSCPQLRCPDHPFSARTISAALPPQCADLQKLIRRDLLHKWARSAKSSQTLALSLFGHAAQNDNSLSWFWDALNLPIDFCSRPLLQFEHCLESSDLGESPRVTKIDLSVATRDTFIAIETKWSEPGFGICSCVRDGDGDPRAGFDCSARVRSRTAYWETAHDFFGLEPVRLPLLPCSLSAAYQPIRLAAAARSLSRGRRAVFALIFDARSPYFAATGQWIGWPALLTSLLQRYEHSGLVFRAISWQALTPNLPLTATVREWARDKHRL